MFAKHLRITGRVQGVFFRAETQRKAHELGLMGWLRNMPDGSVEIHAEGAAAALKELESWCWEGPPAAEVQSVTADDVPEEHHRDFTIRRD